MNQTGALTGARSFAIRAARASRRIARGGAGGGPARREQGAQRDAQIAGYLETHPVRRVQIGAGPKHLEGWLQTDLRPRDARTIFLDATQPFPFPDASLDFVFAEHLIEHITWWDGQAMLAECRRVLRPGGVLRLATPDAAKLISLYTGHAGEEGEHYLQWHHDRFTPRMRTHPLVVLNHNMRTWGHTFLYDVELLTAALVDAGFVNIAPCDLGESDHPELRGVEQHQSGGTGAKERAVRFETMCFEASAPG